MEGAVRGFFRFIRETEEDIDAARLFDRAEATIEASGVKAHHPDYIFWPYYQLIKSGWATLSELETHYSITDVWQAMTALRLMNAVEALEHHARIKK